MSYLQELNDDPSDEVGGPETMVGDTPPSGAVLATFAETLLAGRRVAMLGDSANGLGGLLAAASGRRAHVFDPDAQRAGETMAARRAGSQVAVAPLADGLDDHVGAFDAVVIPDMTGLGNVDELLPRVAALVSKRGVGFWGTPGV